MTTNETNLADAYGLAAITIRDLRGEVERLQADVERLKSVRTQLWSGIGVMRAALTDEQRHQVARICYATTGLCFCGCHETEFDPMLAGEAGEGDR
jgi:hypothetical protein